MESYDVCIIGGGPSGYAAAMRAVDFKKKVLLVERDRIGGAGIYDGALSSKTLWELSREFAAINEKFERYGIAAPQFEYREVARETDEAVRQRAEQLTDHIRHVQQGNENMFHSVTGFGKLLSPNEIRVENGSGAETFRADYIVLATGSRPRYLPHIPIDEKIILTSDGISSLEDLPESIVILGAGVIGCEFATIFSNFGRTKVYLIDKEERILPFEDADLVQVIEANLEERGVHVHRQSRLEEMGIVNGRVEYTLKFHDGRREVFNVEKGLVSVGRVPNYEDMGFEDAGVRLTPAGHVVDNDTLSSVPNIHAVGDLTADIALVNVGELEGRHAIEKIFGKPRRKLIYENISSIMFLNPESAAVGMNEQQAQKRGLDYLVAIYHFRCIPRAIAMRRTVGFFKILVTDDEQMKILGMRAVGEHASSAIQAVALLIWMDQGIEELAELIHPHPSITEGVQECVRMLRGKSIFKPSAFADALVCRRYKDGVYMEI
ncbi:MAG: NAD(P)/FAD-dependent oxidoreductase [SAR324 cluster bacterium]|nr:NAD(P)/FAD-dependent oxidoreductase [SAR324 cluster bacterium]